MEQTGSRTWCSMIWHCSRSIRGVDMILYYCDEISSLRIHCNELVFINAHFYSSCFTEFHFYIISYHTTSCSAASLFHSLMHSSPNWEPSTMTLPYSPLHFSLLLAVILCIYRYLYLYYYHTLFLSLSLSLYALI